MKHNNSKSCIHFFQPSYAIQIIKTYDCLEKPQLTGDVIPLKVAHNANVFLSVLHGTDSISFQNQNHFPDTGGY